jgi:hypothetical protein
MSAAAAIGSPVSVSISRPVKQIGGIPDVGGGVVQNLVQGE